MNQQVSKSICLSTKKLNTALIKKINHKLSILLLFIVIGTNLKILDFNKVSKNKKLSICDLRNLYHPDEFKNKKIKYYSIGRPFHG